MTCEKCGRDATGRLCSDCQNEETFESDGGRFVDVDQDARDGVRTGDCYALKDDGTQCNYSAEDICGVHDGSTGLSRVDDVPNAPVADLRDRLVDVGMTGSHAYYLASHYSTAADLWDATTALDRVEIGDETYEPATFATLAKTIAKLDDVDAGAHPLALDSCIALTDSSKFDGECTNGSYGKGLLCGTHKSANDPETKLDDADFPVVDGHGADHYVVEIRGDSVTVVDTDSWEVEKVHREDVEERLDPDVSDDRVVFYRDDVSDDQGADVPVWELKCTYCDATFDDRDRIADCPECGSISPSVHGVADDAPAHVRGLSEGDGVRIGLEDTDRELEGAVSEVGSGGWDAPQDGAQIRVYVDDVDEVEDNLVLETTLEDDADDWSDVVATEHAWEDGGIEDRIDLGPVAGVTRIQQFGNQSDEDAEPEDDSMSESDDVDVPDWPAIFEGWEDGDRIRVTLEDGDEFSGTVERSESDDGEAAVLVDATNARMYALTSEVDDGEWSDVEAYVESDGEDEWDDLGAVESIDDDEPDEPEDWVDPFVFDRRTNELEEIGLSGREAEVVACKEMGLTHPQIAEYLEIKKGTVDEYSRRALRKVTDARKLVDAVGDVY